MLYLTNNRDKEDMKSEKFKLLAEKRTRNAIKQLRLIGNLANPNSYEYTDAQVDKILSVLTGELKSMERQFNNVRQRQDGVEFSL